MITLYACGSPNVTKVLFALEETRLPYVFEHVLIGQDNYQQEFLALNPNGKVPVIVDEEGPNGASHTVFESGAILIYLAEKSGMLMPEEAVKRSEMLQWLFVQVAYFGPMYGQARHFVSLAPQEGNEYARERYTSEAYRLLDLLETRLSETMYVGGDAFSIADIAMFPGIEFHLRETLKLGDRPNTARWVKAMEGRDSWSRVRIMVGKILEKDYEKAENMTEDQMDRIFGRGKYARTC